MILRFTASPLPGCLLCGVDGDRVCVDHPIVGPQHGFVEVSAAPVPWRVWAGTGIHLVSWPIIAPIM